MGSNLGARALLVVGFIAAFIGYDAWIVSHVVLDPNATRAAAHALLETPAVRRGLADQITKQLDEQLPAATKDPRTPKAVAAAVRDPRVTAAFADTIVHIHEAIVASSAPDGPAEFTVDGRALTAALHDSLARTDPALAAKVAKTPPLTINIKSKDLPRLHDPRSRSDVVAILAIMAALLFITASLILQHDRRSIGRVGRRTAFLAFTPLLVFFVLPRVLVHASGDAPEIASALLRVYGDRVLPSAIALLVVGLVIAIGALVWPRRTAPELVNRSSVAPYTGPPGSAPPAWGTPEQPAITEKLYL